jgi:hypothetical protein
VKTRYPSRCHHKLIIKRWWPLTKSIEVASRSPKRLRTFRFRKYDFAHQANFSFFTVDLMPQRKRGFTLWNMVGSNVPVHPLLGTVFGVILAWMTRIWASTASLAKALSGICFRRVVSALAAQVRKPVAAVYIWLLAGK